MSKNIKQCKPRKFASLMGKTGHITCTVPLFDLRGRPGQPVDNIENERQTINIAKAMYHRKREVQIWTFPSSAERLPWDPRCPPTSRVREESATRCRWWFRAASDCHSPKEVLCLWRGNGTMYSNSIRASWGELWDLPFIFEKTTLN